MKHLLILSTILLLFSACSKQEQPKEFSPTGKTYAAFAYKSVISNSDIYDVYRFTSKTQVEYTGREGSPSGRIMGSPETYTYTLAYPSMTMHNSSGQLLLPFTFISESTFRMTDSRGITYEYNLQ